MALRAKGIPIVVKGWGATSAILRPSSLLKAAHVAALKNVLLPLHA